MFAVNALTIWRDDKMFHGKTTAGIYKESDNLVDLSANPCVKLTNLGKICLTIQSPNLH